MTLLPAQADPARLVLSESSLVLLVGPSGCGKSTFARRRFAPTEVVSSDHFRAIVCDDETNQAASRDAFTILHEVVACRLAWRRFTVVDATNLKAEARRPLLDIARRYHFATAAIVFEMAEETCRRHNEQRDGRRVPEEVIARHVAGFQQGRNALGREGYQHIYALRSPEEAEAAIVVREPLAVGPAGGLIAGRSTSSATFTAASTSCANCSRLLGYRVGEPASSRRPAARPSSSATWATAAPTRPPSTASSSTWWRPGPRPDGRRQPRLETVALASWGTT